ncbi:Hypothetical predicted protein [Marmota monax]|uniref:Uncharacterized protein n=1 Tax=Marmota monax TaxID=9995 RepID=A0A5E4BT06_MARMO|nr:Hypothetical predicted protein [Marmota monax]
MSQKQLAMKSANAPRLAHQGSVQQNPQEDWQWGVRGSKTCSSGRTLPQQSIGGLPAGHGALLSCLHTDTGPHVLGLKKTPDREENSGTAIRELLETLPPGPLEPQRTSEKTVPSPSTPPPSPSPPPHNSCAFGALCS